MVKKIQLKLGNVFEKLKQQTTICKICFKEINNPDLHTFFDSNVCVCPNCERKFSPQFRSFKIGKYHGTAIYDYDELMQGLIYQFKGCYDYELKDIFLNKYYRELSLNYKGYILVPAPSYIEDDNLRGYNHVKEIFAGLKLPIVDFFVKTEKHKQSDQKFHDRKNIKKYIKINKENNLQNKNILLIDDIFTTGSTLKTMIEMIEPLKPKKIRILVLCKTKPK